MGANLAGAFPIIAVDVDSAKLALAREFGATHTVDASEDDVVATVLEMTDGGAAWALEAIGLSHTIEQAVDCLRPGGTAVPMGLAKADGRFSVRSTWIVQGDRTIRGSLYGSANLPVDVPRILGLYEAGRLPLERLLGKSYALEDVNEAYAALVDGAPGRAILLPNGEL
jgi:Zn-dependent alcohol dehydrogenase